MSKKSTYDSFSYKNLSEKLQQVGDVIEDKGYMAFLGGNDNAFYLMSLNSPPDIKSHLYNRNLRTKLQYPFQTRCGLQLHIALSETKATLGYEERAHAWDVIKDVLLKHEVRESKIVMAQAKMSDVPHQTGKDITIDAGKETKRTLQQWNQILNEINSELQKNLISLPSQGAQSSSERGTEYPIRGTHFMTYRYEFGLLENAEDLTAKALQIVPVTIESKETDLLLMANSNSSTSSHSFGSSPLQVEIPSSETAVTIHLSPTRTEQKEKPLASQTGIPTDIKLSTHRNILLPTPSTPPVLLLLDQLQPF